MKTLLIAAAVLFAACTPRTVIHPVPTGPEAPEKYVRQGGCNVRDFTNATELPTGSKNLGWVTVDQQSSDEDTYLLLRQKICELGGNALSQPAWVKDPSAEIPKLTANAWVLP